MIRIKCLSHCKRNSPVRKVCQLSIVTVYNHVILLKILIAWAQFLLIDYKIQHVTYYTTFHFFTRSTYFFFQHLKSFYYFLKFRFVFQDLSTSVVTQWISSSLIINPLGYSRNFEISTRLFTCLRTVNQSISEREMFYKLHHLSLIKPNICALVIFWILQRFSWFSNIYYCVAFKTWA